MALPLDRTRKGKLPSGAKYTVHTRPLVGDIDGNKSKLVSSKAVKESGSTKRATMRSSVHGDGMKSKPRRAESQVKIGKTPGGDTYMSSKRKQGNYRDQETVVQKSRARTIKESSKMTINGSTSKEKRVYPKGKK